MRRPCLGHCRFNGNLPGSCCCRVRSSPTERQHRLVPMFIPLPAGVSEDHSAVEGLKFLQMSSDGIEIPQRLRGAMVCTDFKLRGNMQPRSYLPGKETISKPEGAMILEPRGLGGGKFFLLKTTQIVLKAAEGASCLALEEPALLRPCSQPSTDPPPALPQGSESPVPRGCVVVQEISGKAELCCIIKVYRPIQAVPPPLAVSST
ncbi:uncharacterized protein LOC109144421 [Corvus cornix cornix]|uniref:uncharacterized protein LOC109144421 n=1 Tax=Corvus cornix cornix TaxID=932674 RepID=UPI001950F714|nr:uncharacterized protein LOC109144421 [Corvus cornix cornix]